MLPRLLTPAFLLVLFLCAAAHADPLVITGGTFGGQSVGGTGINISGQNFSFSGTTSFSPVILGVTTFPAGTHALGGTQGFTERGTICFNGTCVSHDNVAQPTSAGGFVTFNVGSFDFPQLGPSGPSTFTFTLPFTMTGSLHGSGPGVTPFSLLVVGQGEMTFTYNTFFQGNGTNYDFRSVQATFADPTPEPATLTLFALGGAGAWLLRRRSSKR